MTIKSGDVFGWLKLGNPSDVKVEQMTRCCDAVESLAARRCYPQYLYVDPDADPRVPLEARDAALDLGLIMQAARLSRRAASPEGIAGSNDFGIVRISRFDPDIADTLADFLESGIV